MLGTSVGKLGFDLKDAQPCGCASLRLKWIVTNYEGHTPGAEAPTLHPMPQRAKPEGLAYLEAKTVTY
jgi:hypothetical protein